MLTKLIKKRRNRSQRRFLSCDWKTHKAKNFLFLCECFEVLIKERPTIKLFIIGEGENFYLLNNFIKNHKLSNNILLLGYKKNIFPYFKKQKVLYCHRCGKIRVSY